MADRHLIIVQHNQQVFVHMRSVVNSLKSHARSHGAIAHNRHGFTFIAKLRRRHSHAECRANRGAGMAHAKGIKVAFRALGESRKAVFVTHGQHLLSSTGENFVRVGLMAHVPDQTIVWRIKHRMQGNSEFGNP